MSQSTLPDHLTKYLPERLSVTYLQAVLAALRTPKIQMIRLTLKGPDDSMLCFELTSEAGKSSFCVLPTLEAS
jgi:hypothetical protein